MFGFGKKVEIKKIDINEGFRQYEKNPGFRHLLPKILITEMQKCFILSKLFAFLFCQILCILMLYGVVFYVTMVLKVIFHETLL